MVLAEDSLHRVDGVLPFASTKAVAVRLFPKGQPASGRACKCLFHKVACFTE